MLARDVRAVVIARDELDIALVDDIFDDDEDGRW